MAKGYYSGGRPYSVADIPFVLGKTQKLWDDFYNATKALNYKEQMALARYFEIHPNTVRNWKYRVTFPRYSIALDVIDWVKRGKPTILHPQSDKYKRFSML